MYRCCECGETFSEPDYRADGMEHCELDDGITYESWSVEVCPNCGTEEIEEVYSCVLCGDAVMEGSGVLCEDCGEEIFNLLDAAYMRLVEEHEVSKSDALEIINEWYERVDNER